MIRGHQDIEGEDEIGAGNERILGRENTLRWDGEHLPKISHLYRNVNNDGRRKIIHVLNGPQQKWRSSLLVIAAVVVVVVVVEAGA